MTADLTREQARDRVALVIAAQRYHYGASAADRDADAALTALWPVVEGLRAELDEARENAEDDERLIRRQGDLLTGVANALRGAPPPLVAWGHSALPDLAFRVKVSMEEARAEVDRLTAELAHAHTVIARHVEPKRSTGSWDQKWPSDALCGDLTGEGCGPGVSGRVDETGGSE